MGYEKKRLIRPNWKPIRETNSIEIFAHDQIIPANVEMPMSVWKTTCPVFKTPLLGGAEILPRM